MGTLYPPWRVCNSVMASRRPRSWSWSPRDSLEVDMQCEAMAGRLRFRARACLLLVCFALSLAPARVSATWSIVAVDPQTREVGVAVASCIGSVEVTAGFAPGKGVVVAQGLSNLASRDRAAQLLARGASPAQVIAEITTPEFDRPGFLKGAKMRQYGVAALDFGETTASYTGSWTVGWSGSARGDGVSVQGNVLYGEEVISDALRAFEAEPGALGERLLAALEAGSAAGGDKRCAKSLSALSAFLAVARPDDSARVPYLRLLVPYAGETDASRWTFLRQLVCPVQGEVSQNPVRRLRERYEQWREKVRLK